MEPDTFNCQLLINGQLYYLRKEVLRSAVFYVGWFVR